MKNSKIRITKKEYEARGGMANGDLFRVANSRGVWGYYSATDGREALAAALRELSDAVKPTREGKRDGYTFGRLSIADDQARAVLAWAAP